MTALDDTTAEGRNRGDMSFWDHLGELRSRLIKSLLAIGVGAIVIFAAWGPVSDFFVEPYCNALADVRPDEEIDPRDCQLVFLNPVDSLRTRFTVSFFGGLALAMPVVLWQVWRFITPALKPNERKWAIPFVVAGVVLFAAGVALGYWTFPRALGFFIEVGGENFRALFGASEYFRLLTFLVLSFGIGFEFPILLIFMQLAGIIEPRHLAKYRRHAIVGIVVLAAVITPTGDPITLGALSIPLYIFYEASIVIGWLLTRKRRDQPQRSLRERLPSWLGGSR